MPCVHFSTRYNEPYSPDIKRHFSVPSGRFGAPRWMRMIMADDLVASVAFGANGRKQSSRIDFEVARRVFRNICHWYRADNVRFFAQKKSASFDFGRSCCFAQNSLLRGS